MDLYEFKVSQSGLHRASQANQSCLSETMAQKERERETGGREGKGGWRVRKEEKKVGRVVKLRSIERNDEV